MELLYLYLILMNALSFLFMLADKHRAQKKKWRIPESTLLLSALLGGGWGALAGMVLFRHKTRHPLFTAGLPLIAVAQALGIYLLAK